MYIYTYIYTYIYILYIYIYYFYVNTYIILCQKWINTCLSTFDYIYEKINPCACNLYW